MHASSYPQDSAAPQKGARSGVRVPNEVDAELGRRMSNGDEDAFATFYDRFAPGLFSLIYGILHDQKESEDVLQEAFVQMWKRIATYDRAPEQLVYLGGHDFATQGHRSLALPATAIPPQRGRGE